MKKKGKRLGAITMAAMTFFFSMRQCSGGRKCIPGTVGRHGDC